MVQGIEKVAPHMCIQKLESALRSISMHTVRHLLRKSHISNTLDRTRQVCKNKLMLIPEIVGSCILSTLKEANATNNYMHPSYFGQTSKEWGDILRAMSKYADSDV